MIEPIVAELDVRKKVEMLKVRFKMMPEGNEWRSKFLSWLKKVESVNDHRNIVAHHRVEMEGGKVRLKSTQLVKIMKSIDPLMRPKPDKGLADIKRWVDEAQAAFDVGQIVFENIDRFRTKALKKAAAAK